jgi:hypothetical protein
MAVLFSAARSNISFSLAWPYFACDGVEEKRTNSKHMTALLSPESKHMRAACVCRLGSIPGRLVALWYYKRICLPSASSTYFFGRRFIMQELCQPRVSYSYTLCVYTYA